MVNRVSKTKKLFKYLEKSKVDEILERARINKRDYLLILTLWRTGIRNSELVNLKKKDIKDNRIIIHQGKGHKDRWVPLDKNLRTLLEYHTADMTLDDRVFPISTVQVRNIVHKYQGDEYIKPHTFRHSFAVYYLKSGGNIRVLQKILGHSDLNTTAVYLDLIGEDIINDFNKIEW